VPSRWLATLLLLGAMLTSVSPRAAEGQAGTTVRDLYYGEVLFQFYRQDDFTALTHLLAARQAGRVSRHEAEAELLLGGLYLSYGQHDRAADIFERLLAGQVSAEVRDRAWFYLGKLRYQRGLYADALSTFARIGKDLPEALAVELPMLVAQSHMALGDFAAAERVLQEWDAEEGWLAYARYNLGVALVRLDRLPEGARLLDRVGRMGAATDEEKELRDKANLALGYAYLQRNDAAAARPVLQRVRLKSAFANKALLGAGWADAIEGNYRDALVPWLELVDRDLLDSAVQEAFLAVPYALGKLEAHGSAVGRYQEALALFDTEMEQVDTAVARAQTGELLPALLEGDDLDLGRWYWRLETLPDNSEARYLYHLLADHDFQEGFKNYRDLTALERQLTDWQERLATYAVMVEARQAAFAERLPAADARLAAIDRDELQSRRDALAARVEAARESRDVVALAQPGELDAWQRLAALEHAPEFAGADPALRQRHRLLKGVVAWDMDREFRLRLWQGERQLRELDRTLAAADAGLAALAAARESEPRRFAEFAARIAALTPRVAAMRADIGATRLHQERGLVAMATSELTARKQRLASYRVQARFALATIFDRAGAHQAALGDPP
jgi:tetratricopeptide (TPR) repeat protein